MNTSDAQLSEHLNQMARTLYAQRQALFATHTGSCACDDHSLCSFHAQTFNELIKIERLLVIEYKRLTDGH